MSYGCLLKLCYALNYIVIGDHWLSTQNFLQVYTFNHLGLATFKVHYQSQTYTTTHDYYCAR